MDIIKTDVVIIGAGVGGIGAVYRLIKNNIKVTVIDKNPYYGGTMVYAGINCFEPGVSQYALSSILAEKLQMIENGGSVAKTIPNHNIFHLNDKIYDWEKHSGNYPWGLSICDKDEDYKSTLNRCDLFKKDFKEWRRFQFDDEAMKQAISDTFYPYKKNITEYFNSEFIECETNNNKIESVIIMHNNKMTKITAKYFIDSSGDIILARKAGCKCVIGSQNVDANSDVLTKFNKSNKINGVTYSFRVQKVSDVDYIDEIPLKYQNINIEDWKNNILYKDNCIACFNQYPNMDININMLPSLTGNEHFNLQSDSEDIGKARLYAFWNYIQKEKGLRGYKMIKIFPMAGIRESYRLCGKYTLTEYDVTAGLVKQKMQEQIIALADHPLDTHGEPINFSGSVKKPYGIPFDCLVPKEYDNLFIACRGASFTHIAASSCRLGRTIMAIGEAVGEAITQLIQFNKIDFVLLREQLNLIEYENQLRKIIVEEKE